MLAFLSLLSLALNQCSKSLAQLGPAQRSQTRLDHSIRHPIAFQCPNYPQSLQAFTSSYKLIHALTSSYKLVQSLTNSCKLSQALTSSYKLLQALTNSYTLLRTHTNLHKLLQTLANLTNSYKLYEIIIINDIFAYTNGMRGR